MMAPCLQVTIVSVTHLIGFTLTSYFIYFCSFGFGFWIRHSSTQRLLLTVLEIGSCSQWFLKDNISVPLNLCILHAKYVLNPLTYFSGPSLMYWKAYQMSLNLFSQISPVHHFFSFHYIITMIVITVHLYTFFKDIRFHFFIILKFFFKF